jgi:hypothetical protein
LAVSLPVLACARGSSVGIGRIALSLSLPDDDSIVQVTYRIHAGAPTTIDDVTGTIDTSDRNATPSIDRSFPASTGDTVTLTATTAAGKSCSGTSSPFDVVPGGEHAVQVTVACGEVVRDPPVAGSVVVGATVVDESSCPVLTAWSASPLVATSPTGAIDVSVSATGPIGPPLYYAWSPAARFGDPTQPSTSFWCATAGSDTLTVTVSTPPGPTSCSRSVSIPVTCTPGAECAVAASPTTSPLDCTLSPPSVPSSLTPADPADYEQIAVAAKMGVLDRVVGRYVRGDLRIYRGTASAHDNESVLGDPQFPTNRAIFPGLAMASLEYGGGEAFLTVVSPCQQEWVQFSQFPYNGHLTIDQHTIHTNSELDGYSNDLSYGCVDCLPSFFGLPQALSWTDLELAPDGLPYRSSSSANLQLESPCDLTWEELVAIDGPEFGGAGSPPGLEGFQRVGDEMVRHESGQAVQYLPEGSPCPELIVDYEIDLYVNATNLADYGVRGYVGSAPHCP